eukprot:8299063-Ditylum_brightwellii.AAC.1
MGDNIEHGTHSVTITTVDGIKLIAMAYHGQSEKGKKNKTTKTNFYSYFLASECITTLDEKPAEKKRHYPNGSRAPSKFVPRCKSVEECYEWMLTSNIVNRSTQFMIGIEEAIWTTNIFKRIPCS